MTKQTKYILLGVLGLGLAGGAIVVFAVLAIGISIMAAQPDDATAQNKPSVTRGGKQTKQSESDPNESNESVDDEEATKVSGSLAPEMVGKWQRSEGSGHVDYTGKTQYRSGAYFNYEFSADGTVKYSMEKDVLSIIQCKINETKSAKGKAATSGDTLTLSFGKMNHTSSNSCETDDDFEKTLPAETVELQWRMKTEYEVTRLCIEEKDGEQCYDRKE